ncbi:hypothetical protein VPNG_06370 [Cytospora leucostoma]|uniref:Uncharacterized protein n=1 Tax=Cytospora leucostoma TaxID=1230097 RepID=A0A423WYW3_9PEZI|nr:hypothetical protein VPNG_06370 [Cytospora leucostoma]
MSLSTAKEVVRKFPLQMVEGLSLYGLFEKAGAEIQGEMSVRLNQVVVIAQKES